MRDFFGLPGKVLRKPAYAVYYASNWVKRHSRLTGASRLRDHGERVVIGNWKSAKRSNDGAVLAHIQRYEWALAQVQGLSCLDAGCGSGYGTHFLASNGVKKIVGIDISEKAIRYCIKRYAGTSNCTFTVMDVRNLKFSDGCFDAAVSFDVLEHLDLKGQEVFIRELARVLDKDGFALIGCPNELKSTHVNPFHLNELTCSQLDSLLSNYFAEVIIYGQDLTIEEPSGLWGRLPVRLKLPQLIFSISEDTRETALGLVAACREPLGNTSC